jgi:addiction module HigA family antidote
MTEETPMTMTEKRPIYPIHPGEILADELAELNMTPAELARQIHVPANRIYQLIAGKRAMTADTALRLQQWLGVSAAFWMNLQKRYELNLAAEQIGEEITRTIHRIKPFQPEQPVHI